jgi:GMP synthase (glutamine-hydrolysing)
MDKILIIDFGSQVTQLIARRIRHIGTFTEIRSHNITYEQIVAFNPQAIILSGGPASVGENSPTVTAKIFSMNIPILGICYGQQLICSMLGGVVEPGDSREFGRAQLEISQDSKLFTGLWNAGESYPVWMSHGDRVTKLPEGFEVIAITDHAPFAVISDGVRKIYGVQFHPEVTHTEGGTELLKNFVQDIAGCKPSWNMASFLETQISAIKAQVGSNKVICAVSGGVDSSVVATLLHKALGDKLHTIFVNTGLLRLNEAEQVQRIFHEQLDIPLQYYDASELFLEKLAGVSDPEKKRKIIGGLFIDIFEQEAKKLGDIKFLAQGTLYSDVVESSAGSGASATIKSHHNVGGLPERMNLQLIEPLKEIFKDEVRDLGRELGIGGEVLSRHPFPGPGLAIRIPGAVDKEKVRILQEADAIYIDELKKAGLYDDIWQAFAILLPVKTVGVMGDGRTYENVLALRAVNSFDGMTADFYPFSHEFLSKVSNRIVNQVRGVNRIVYDITSKPPGTIEWE